ncbi:hypothetical protein HCG49_14760 [Arenibacter sp. 6A1]|uniref:hypothetical protein n=1 Tax=Arenibacter sp. 6A1 TaxID=2720391 RepID=UPI0014462F60|nr:hypothetical protein [Arenibacter sp. 6A1]NKI27824.1 hypothetical protein [Arenibacter sp. 6A1]
MDNQQSFNVNMPGMDGYDVLFVKLVLVIIIFSLLLAILNFLRDKFINKTTDTNREDISGLLIVLNKLFFIGGFGFVIANIIKVILSQSKRNSGFPSVRFGGEWDYLIFGIILVFLGIGFKVSRKVLKKESAISSETKN